MLSPPAFVKKEPLLLRGGAGKLCEGEGWTLIFFLALAYSKST